MAAKWIEEIQRFTEIVYPNKNNHLLIEAVQSCEQLLLEIDRLNGLIEKLEKFPDKILPFLCCPDPGNGFGKACIKTAIEMTQAARLKGE